MNRRVRISAISVATVDGMVAENFARALRLGRIALAEGPDVFLFPEAFAAGYCGNDLRPYGESLDEQWPGEFRQLSADGNCMVVFGFLEKVPGGVRNSAAIYDRGELVGVHAKRSMWPDDERPYRDERALLVPGSRMEVYETRLGRFAVLICYENMLPGNWDEVAGRVDFVLSPYNCQGDPSHNNVRHAQRLHIPSAWADRTGTVYQGNGYQANMGTAGLVSADGEVIEISPPGVESIVTGEIDLA